MRFKTRIKWDHGLILGTRLLQAHVLHWGGRDLHVVTICGWGGSSHYLWVGRGQSLFVGGEGAVIILTLSLYIGGGRVSHYL